MMDFCWFYEGGSYLGIILFLILTGCGLPIPEEVAIVYAGVASAAGELNTTLAIGACLIGAILGDCVMYGIGNRLGHAWIRHHPLYAKWMHLEREKQMEDLIRRHGLKVFFLARFMVGVRGPMYVAAGVLKVPFRTFLIVDIICASTVIGIFFSLSYFIGQDVLAWIQQAEWWFTGALATIVAVAIGVFIWRRRRAKRQPVLIELLEKHPPREQPADQSDQSETVGSRQ